MMVRLGSGTVVWRVFALFLSTAIASARLLDRPDKFCVKYFGSVEVLLKLPQESPSKNYNGTVDCPLEWHFEGTKGGTLTICPPSYGLWWEEKKDNINLDVELRFSNGAVTESYKPIDNVLLQHLLITNGSITGPFSSNGTPAILAPDKKPLVTQRFPTWTVNGTQRALIDSNLWRTARGAYLTCDTLPDRGAPQYCGDPYDIRQDGCWSRTQLGFNFTNPMNFTVRFSTAEATVDLWFEQAYTRYDGTSVGANQKVYMQFTGDRKLPDEDDLEFWDTSELNYTYEDINWNDIAFLPDEEGFPYFINDSTSGAKESYYTSNTTGIERSGSARTAGALSTLGLAVSIFLAFLAYL